jgi:TonB family protein
MSDKRARDRNLIKLCKAISSRGPNVLWKARALGLLLTLVAGVAHGEVSRISAAEVQVASPAIKVKRIRYTAPKYPPKALQGRVSGFVTIEFVIDTKGQPTGLRVVDAYPAEIFERAVLAAAKRWRYKPLVVDNAPTQTPTRTIVRFETHS